MTDKPVLDGTVLHRDGPTVKAGTEALRKARRRLVEALDIYDREVDWQMSNDGERADLWTEIDVNVEDLRALLSQPEQLGAEPVGVKPLDWNPFRAETPFGGYYYVDEQTGHEKPFLLSGSRIDLARFPTLEAAKAAAQADYERRIRSALYTLPKPGEADGCTCQGCGLRYRGDLLVSDVVWEKIKPEGKPDGAGLLCPSCIMRRIVERGIWTAARASDVDAGEADGALVELAAEMADLLDAFKPLADEGSKVHKALDRYASLQSKGGTDG